MRSEHEKKTITTSVKMSEAQKHIIEQRAKEKGMSVSSYLVDCAIHGESVLTPEILVKIQEMTNTANQIADALSYGDRNEYKLKKSVRVIRGMLGNMIQDNSEAVIKDGAEKLQKGSTELWAYLK